MSYEVIAHSQGCEGGSCPTIYFDKSRGTIAIQGYESGSGAPAAPTGEGLVEMPLNVFLDLVKQVRV